MNFFITGGAGFIGTKLTQALLKDQTSHVVIYDSLLPQVHGEGARFPVVDPRVKNIRGDIQDFELLSKSINDDPPSVIIHLASDTGTSQSMDEIRRYNNVNVGGTANLLEAIRNSIKSPPRIILASSRSIYGEGPWLDETGRRHSPPPRNSNDLSRGVFNPQVQGLRLTEPALTLESDLIRPASVYASTKYMQELLIDNLAETFSNIAFLRFQNVYGEGQSLRNPYTGVLSIFCKQILEGKTLNIFEDGQITRDFVHVSDVVNAIILASKTTVTKLTANVGSGRPATILEVAQILLSTLGEPTHKFVVSGNFRSGDIRYACADIRQAQQHLNWHPYVTLEDGLASLADWAKRTHFHPSHT